jgi:hypothetical protein
MCKELAVTVVVVGATVAVAVGVAEAAVVVVAVAEKATAVAAAVAMPAVGWAAGSIPASPFCPEICTCCSHRRMHTDDTNLRLRA